MARVLSRGKKASARPLVARIKHDCGALVEFTESDVSQDRDGAYVVCPACKGLPWIAESVLRWKRHRPVGADAKGGGA